MHSVLDATFFPFCVRKIQKQKYIQVLHVAKTNKQCIQPVHVAKAGRKSYPRHFQARFLTHTVCSPVQKRVLVILETDSAMLGSMCAVQTQTRINGSEKCNLGYESRLFALLPHLCKCFQADTFRVLLPPGVGTRGALLCARPVSSCGGSCRSSSPLWKKLECRRNSAQGRAKTPYLCACPCLFAHWCKNPVKKLSARKYQGSKP